MIERASIIRDSDRISIKDLPGFIGAGSGGEYTASNLNVGGLVTLDELEKAHILAVLESTAGARKQTSEILGINASTLYRKLKKYGLQDIGETEDVETEDDESGNPTVPGAELLEAVESAIRENAGETTETPEAEAEAEPVTVG